MKQKPAISVIVPCYNQGRFLSDALQSVAEQTFQEWECIIINDGATDNTHEIANMWVEKDKRFRYIKQENMGLSSARNAGLQKAAGDYIQFLDADDTIENEKFSVSLKAIENAHLVITNFRLFSKMPDEFMFTEPNCRLSQVTIDFKSILTEWDRKFVIPIHCGFFRRSIFNGFQFNESLKAREDWLMWLHLYRRQLQTTFIDQPFANYRVNPGSMSQDRSLMGKSLAHVFSLAYEITPEMYRSDLFHIAIEKLEDLLDESESILTRTRQSFSFRFGNFFVRNIGKVKSRIRRHDE